MFVFLVSKVVVLGDITTEKISPIISARSYVRGD